MTAYHLPQEAEGVRIVEGFELLDTRANRLRQRIAGNLPIPSMVRMAARSKPDGKYAEAAWAIWWGTK